MKKAPNGATIKYTSPDGYKGILYNWHYDSFTGKWEYAMSIWDKDDFEVLHAYNASPKTLEELKDVVDNIFHSGNGK